MSAPTSASASPAGAPTSPDRPRPGPGRWWRSLDTWVGFAIVVACVVYVAVQLQPGLVLRNSTPNGGDLGAHVWWPAFLRDHLLPWRLAGWSPDFYAGFPAGQFYFPVPALTIVALDVLLPYGIAFKLVVCLGAVLLPLAAWTFGRGLRAPNPVPAAMAVAATAFLFFTGDPGTSEVAKAIAFNQRIMGGTLASTLAGEFSFTLALAFALFFFGALARALRTRAHLWLPAVLLGACLTSHLIVGIFAALGALAVWLFAGPLRSLARMAAIGAVGVLLASVWLLPLAATMKYTTNMRYGPLGLDAPEGQSFTDYMLPRYFFAPLGWEPYRWGAYVLVAVALVGAVAFVRRSTFTLVVLTALCGLTFRFWTDLGSHVWNLRLLSFWYLGIHFLMAVGVAELVRGAGWLGARATTRVRDRRSVRAAFAAGEEGDGGERDGDDRAAVADAADDAPARRRLTERIDDPPAVVAMALMIALTLALGVGALVGVNHDRGFLPYWAKWNFSGYENTVDEVTGTYTAPCTEAGATAPPASDSASGTLSAPGASTTTVAPTGLCTYDTTLAIAKEWPEYRALMRTLEQLPPGRSLWEGGPDLDRYGTPLALMLIPYWTDGRITTMEGVYFEASGTTPYHFEAVAALVAPGLASNPVRGVPYRDQTSFDVGVSYLQALGVRYFIANNPTTEAKAAADPRLTLVATSPDLDGASPSDWHIYEVADSELVTGLAYEPVIATGVAPGPEGWEQEIAAPWWWFPDQLATPVAADGPADWSRARGSAALRLPRTPIAPVEVSRIRRTDGEIRFHVDRVGRPVLVRESWFPNWEVEGARGPFRVTPNFMVVVPTAHDVVLRYGTTPAEWAGRLGTLLGLLGLAALVVWGRRGGAGPRRARRARRAGEAGTARTPAASGTISGAPRA